MDLQERTNGNRDAVKKPLMHASKQKVNSSLLEHQLFKWLETLEKVSGLPLAFADWQGNLWVKTDRFAAKEASFSSTSLMKSQKLVLAQIGKENIKEFTGTLLALTNTETPQVFVDLLGRILEILWINQWDQNAELESMSQEILTRYEEVNLFYDLSEELASIFEKEKILEIILRKARDILNANLAWFFLCNESGCQVQLVKEVSDCEKIEPGLLEDIKSLCSWSYRAGQNILIESRQELQRMTKELDLPCKSESASELSSLISPVMVRDTRLGAIAVARTLKYQPFTCGDHKLLAAIGSMAAVSLYNSHLIEELKREEIARHDLQIAATIQQNLLPQEIPSLPGIDLGSHYIAANKVGGDYLDYLVDDQGNLHLVIADVSGHNIGAALAMAGTRMVVRSCLLKKTDPADVLQETNRVIYEDLSRSDLFLSAIICCFQPKSKTLKIANAGHNPAFLWRAEVQEAQWFYAQQFFIGLVPDLELSAKTLTLKVGDVFLLYTDGLIEATNPDGERYETERLASVVASAARLSAQEIIEKISSDIKQFMHRESFDDDISILAMKVTQ